MNKFIIKTLTLILLVSILLSNFCYASTLTNDTLKQSLTKIFGSNVKIETIVENDTSSGTSTTTYTAPSELIINDNQIILSETDGESSVTYTIDYLLEDNNLEFIIDSDFTNLDLESDAEDMAMSLLALIMIQNQSIQLCYLSTADALGLDLEVAASYYSQLLSSSSEEIEDESTGEQITKYENDIFTYTITSAGESAEDASMLSSMVINIENFSKVIEADLDGTTTSIITISDTPTIDEDESEENNTVENTNTENTNTETNTSENNVVNRNVIHLNTDNTVANTVIPAAGSTNPSFIILFIIALGLFFYSRSKYYDEIL